MRTRIVQLVIALMWVLVAFAAGYAFAHKHTFGNSNIPRARVSASTPWAAPTVSTRVPESMCGVCLHVGASPTSNTSTYMWVFIPPIPQCGIADYLSDCVPNFGTSCYTCPPPATSPHASAVHRCRRALTSH